MISLEIEGNFFVFFRGRVNDIIDQSSSFGHLESSRTVIKGVIPVESTVGYTTFLRFDFCIKIYI